MSFKNLDKPELLEVAEAFGVDVEADLSLAKMQSKLLADGITWDMWTQHKSLIEAAKEQETPEEDDEPVAAPVSIQDAVTSFRSRPTKHILKMVRENGTYEVIGYKFTKQHPFVIVDGDDATWILQHVEGFRLATPGEAQEFYK